MTNPRSSTDIITGAFGYSGSYIARRLLERGGTIRTITNSPQRESALRGSIEAHPLNFQNRAELVRSMQGGDTLFNTYWVRFDHDDFTHSIAVENTLTLFAAAKEAGIKRVVHVSITNPSVESHLPYFRGKAKLEEALIESGISYAILRPTVLFGREDILVNNIAWGLRNVPLFPLFGTGEYRIQPIYVDDLAEIAVTQGELAENKIIDAIGPETFTFSEFVRVLRTAMHLHTPIVPLPPSLAYVGTKLINAFTKDVLITRDEIDGLMADLLYTTSQPSGTTRFSTWVQVHATELGKNYASELARRRDRVTPY